MSEHQFQIFSDVRHDCAIVLIIIILEHRPKSDNSFFVDKSTMLKIKLFTLVNYVMTVDKLSDII